MAKRVATTAVAGILVQIGLMDLSLSIDNVIAAIGLAPKNEAGNPVMWPIYLGVLIAIVALQAIAPHAMTLLRKYPILEPTAFVLIGYVGVLLLLEEAAHLITGTAYHVQPYVKFAGILFIIWVALLYAADGAVRRIVRPIVHVAVPVMRGITVAIAVLVWPLTRLLNLSTGRAARR
jgi:predicted tellurium resistance membrane protein TerC